MSKWMWTHLKATKNKIKGVTIMGLHIPRYGWYGGPGHSGERRLNDDPNGELWLDPDTGKTVPYYYAPKDSLDAVFKQHDLDYGKAMQYAGAERIARKMVADIKLIYDVCTLNPGDPDYPTDPYSSAYMNGVKLAFEAKWHLMPRELQWSCLQRL
ncbi:MAG TPA: hypothetical protein PK344_02465 [Syntrophorhabdaceae bacterium]|nr:hypothetical protein [Syntrophorhabdaceae bacterium]